MDTRDDVIEQQPGMFDCKLAPEEDIEKVHENMKKGDSYLAYDFSWAKKKEERGSVSVLKFFKAPDGSIHQVKMILSLPDFAELIGTYDLRNREGRKYANPGEVLEKLGFNEK